MDIITRAEARRQGLKRYYTGKPCKRLHYAERQVSNLTCIECMLEKQRANPWHRRSEENRAIHNARGVAWKAANPEKVAKARAEYAAKPETVSRTAEWYQANRERVRAKQAEYNREKRAENLVRSRAWVEANPERAREHFRLARRR